MLCDKLSKGIGHNGYGEPAWPNDILYIFPVVIFGTRSCLLGLASVEPIGLEQRGTPLATPLEILPEWYFFPTFNMLRILPDKLIGILTMLYFPAMMLLVPFIENMNRYQNPLRRSIALCMYLTSLMYSIWLGIGSLLNINEALPLI